MKAHLNLRRYVQCIITRKVLVPDEEIVEEFTFPPNVCYSSIDQSFNLRKLDTTKSVD